MDDAQWDQLIERIAQGKCTPFLGAGASYGSIPLAANIASKWAGTSKRGGYDYPLENKKDLAQVSRYVAVRVAGDGPIDYVRPKDLLLKGWFKNLKGPDFSQEDEPHAMLAELPLPVYITTNYDDFMFRALKARAGKTPRLMLCKWNQNIDISPKDKDFIEDDGLETLPPSDQEPVVFHLHGHLNYPESLVLTEDDYLDFLVTISRENNLLPPRIQRALAGSSILFIGYSIQDLTFRVLFRNVLDYMHKGSWRTHLSVQLPPLNQKTATADQTQRAKEFLNRYFRDEAISVDWVTAREFTRELRKRWKAHQNSQQPPDALPGGKTP